jgi:hypothetical protein
MRPLSIVAVSLVVSGVVFAEKKPRVAVEAPAPIAKLLKAALTKKYTVVPSDQALTVDSSSDDIQQAIDAGNSAALVLATKAQSQVTISIFDTNGQAVDSVKLTSPGKKALKSLGKQAPKQVLAALAKAKTVKRKEVDSKPVAKTDESAPKAAEPQAPEQASTKTEAIQDLSNVEQEVAPKVASPPTVESSASEVPATDKPKRDSFHASLGYRGFNRSLSFSGDSTNQLAQYSTSFAGGVAVDAQWFPLTTLTDSFASNLGLFGQGDFTLGLTSQLGDSSFSTRSDRIRGGLVVRIPVASLALLPHVGISSHSFRIASTAANTAALRPNIPDVVYFGPRGGLGATIAAGTRVTIDANLAFTYTLRRGEIESDRFFPGASAFALDGAVGVSVGVIEHLDVRLGVDYARYFIRLPASASFTATAAGDQYIGASLSAVWRME